jgi:transposase
MEVKQMPETTIDKNLAKERLERYLATHDIKIARTFEELLGPKTGQSPEEITAEVDEFEAMREEWRKEDRERFIN